MGCISSWKPHHRSCTASSNYLAQVTRPLIDGEHWTLISTQNAKPSAPKPSATAKPSTDTIKKPTGSISKAAAPKPPPPKIVVPTQQELEAEQDPAQEPISPVQQEEDQVDEVQETSQPAPVVRSKRPLETQPVPQPKKQSILKNTSVLAEHQELEIERVYRESLEDNPDELAKVVASEQDVRAAEEFMRGKSLEGVIKHLLVDKYVEDRCAARLARLCRSRKVGTGKDAHWDWRGITYLQNRASVGDAFRINFEEANKNNQYVKFPRSDQKAQSGANATSSGL